LLGLILVNRRVVAYVPDLILAENYNLHDRFVIRVFLWKTHNLRKSHAN